MEKENDLVVSSQGSDPSLVKLGINSWVFLVKQQDKEIILF